MPVARARRLLRADRPRRASTTRSTASRRTGRSARSRREVGMVPEGAQVRLHVLLLRLRRGRAPRHLRGQRLARRTSSGTRSATRRGASRSGTSPRRPGVKFGQQQNPQASMGCCIADINQDGLIDIFVTNFSHDYNNIFIGHALPRRRLVQGPGPPDDGPGGLLRPVVGLRLVRLRPRRRPRPPHRERARLPGDRPVREDGHRLRAVPGRVRAPRRAEAQVPRGRAQAVPRPQREAAARPDREGPVRRARASRSRSATARRASTTSTTTATST